MSCVSEDVTSGLGVGASLRKIVERTIRNRNDMATNKRSTLIKRADLYENAFIYCGSPSSTPDRFSYATCSMPRITSEKWTCKIRYHRNNEASVSSA